MAPDTLTQIKLDLRISHDKLDTAIESDIAACLVDLQTHGIVHKDDTDPLILNAVKLWSRSLYTDDPAKAAEWRIRYEALRDCLKATEGYGWEADSDE